MCPLSRYCVDMCLLSRYCVDMCLLSSYCADRFCLAYEWVPFEYSIVPLGAYKHAKVLHIHAISISHPFVHTS